MRKLVTTLILFYSTLLIASKSFAEEYVCSYIYDGNSVTVVFKRYSEQLFDVIPQHGVMTQENVLFQNQTYLVLGGLTGFGSICWHHLADSYR